MLMPIALPLPRQKNARFKAWKEPGGEGLGAREIKVRSCLTGFGDAQEQASTQVSNHGKFFDAQTTLWPSLTLRLTYVHLDSCSLTITHTLFPGDDC